MLKKRRDPGLITYHELLPQVLEKIRERDWSVKDGLFLYRFPYWLLKRVYSSISTIIYEGRYAKGRVEYLYIPEEYTIDSIPIIVDVQLLLGDAPKDAKFMSYGELRRTFRNNKFVT